MSLICKWMKSHFHMKEWAPRLALTKRLEVIRKWAIAITNVWNQNIKNYIIIQFPKWEFSFQKETLKETIIIWKILHQNFPWKKLLLTKCASDVITQINSDKQNGIVDDLKPFQARKQMSLKLFLKWNFGVHFILFLWEHSNVVWLSWGFNNLDIRALR